jgi:hypothetical protein
MWPESATGHDRAAPSLFEVFAPPFPILPIMAVSERKLAQAVMDRPPRFYLLAKAVRSRAINRANAAHASWTTALRHLIKKRPLNVAYSLLQSACRPGDSLLLAYTSLMPQSESPSMGQQIGGMHSPNNCFRMVAKKEKACEPCATKCDRVANGDFSRMESLGGSGPGLRWVRILLSVNPSGE